MNENNTQQNNFNNMQSVNYNEQTVTPPQYVSSPQQPAMQNDTNTQNMYNNQTPSTQIENNNVYQQEVISNVEQKMEQQNAVPDQKQKKQKLPGEVKTMIIFVVTLLILMNYFPTIYKILSDIKLMIFR